MQIGKRFWYVLAELKRRDNIEVAMKGSELHIMKYSSRQIGQQNEKLAAEHLRAHGYTIMARNWRCATGEIDIIARQDETLVFVEVRSRSGSTTAAALETIVRRKQHKLIQLAHEYLAHHGLEDADWRIDVIGIAMRGGAPPLIDHVENALDW